jgi:hypothetical protein
VEWFVTYFCIVLDEWLSSKIDHHKKYQFRILSEKQYEIGKKNAVFLRNR